MFNQSMAQTQQQTATKSDDGLMQHRQNLGVPIAKLQKAQSTSHRAEEGYPASVSASRANISAAISSKLRNGLNL